MRTEKVRTKAGDRLLARNAGTIRHDPAMLEWLTNDIRAIEQEAFDKGLAATPEPTLDAERHTVWLVADTLMERWQNGQFLRTMEGRRIDIIGVERNPDGSLTPTFQETDDGIRLVPHTDDAAFTRTLRMYADRAHDNQTYRTLVPEHVLRDAAAVIDDYRAMTTAAPSLDHPMGAKAMVEQPPGPPDAPKREYPEPMA